MRNLVAVPVTAGEGFATGAPRTLFSALPHYSDGNSTSYDVPVDGTRFLMISQPIDQTLVVVLNWIEELRER